MLGKPRRVILCPSCGRLTNADAAECLICGRRNPGMWGMTGLAQRVFRGRDVARVIMIVCIALYVASLVFDPGAALRPRGPFDLLSPSGPALDALGMTGAFAWANGRWWTLLTAIYLHGGVLHILFNVMWIRQLGPAVEEMYGRARLVVIFTVSGVAGFVVSNMLGVPFTVGASGAIFGLLGAMVAFGRKRGGTYGALVLRQYGQWALILFIFGFFMPGVNNFAHAGGFVGGAATGFLVSLADQRRETGLEQLLAAVCVGLTIVAFGFALFRAFAG
ncbi:MAG: rhomboid family intramembrane serine protease [Candidatus Rokubacteria bacterium]|nr:rhomboid family intramembrane serine protease [Candidatus Rokubacteria bacterium]